MSAVSRKVKAQFEGPVNGGDGFIVIASAVNSDMPMQPRPRAETLRPLRPSSRNCIMIPFRKRRNLLGCYLVDADERLPGFSHIADLARWNSSVLHLEDELVAIVLGDRDEQPPSGLRIEEETFSSGLIAAS